MSKLKAQFFSTFSAGLPPIEEGEGPHKGLRRYQIGKVGPVKRFMGTITITKKHFAEAVKNFKANAAGVTHPKTQLPAVHWDYSHDAGGKAAGWIHDLETDGEGLYAWSAWTPKAEQALSDGEFIGASMEIDFAHVDNDGKEWGAVLLGCALTNIPALKGMDPVALQELQEQEATQTKEHEMKELLEKFKAATEAEKLSMLTEILKLAGKEGVIELAAQATATKTELDALKLQVAQGGDKALQAEVTRLSAENATLTTTLATQKKEAAFADLLAKGLAVPAQKESFMAGDMATFASLSTTVNMDPAKGSGADKGAAAAKDAAEAGSKLVALAEAYASQHKVDFKSAVSSVRKDPANAALVKLADA